MYKRNEKMKKISKIQLVLFTITCICFIYILINIYIYTGTKTNNSKLSFKDTYSPWLISPTNIEIDSQGLIYLSTNRNIIVLNENGKFLYSYRVDTSGAYLFKIDDADNIVVGLVRENYIYIYNQSGIIISETLQSDTKWHKDLPESNKVISSNGVVYECTNLFGYTRIATINGNNKEIIYSIPFNLFILKYFIAITFIGYFLSIVLIVLRTLPEKQKKYFGNLYKYLDQ